MTVLTGASPVDELADAAEAGWPRAFIEWDGERMPMPWVNGTAPATGTFTALNGWRSRECEARRLCFCCGLPLARLQIMGRHGATFDGDGHTIYLTDGPPGHPRCLALAAAHCPHLRGQHNGDLDYVIALAWDGIDRLGYVEVPKETRSAGEDVPRLVVRPGAVPLTLGRLRELASSDPLGERGL